MGRLISLLAGLLGVTGLPYVIFAGVYGLIRPSGSPAEKRPAEPEVSVVLPTYNEERIVEGKLRELVSLDYPMGNVEIVVVDSSTDGTPHIVREFFASREVPELTLIHEDDRRGLAVALNEAYEAAENEVVVKTDCDSRLGEDVLRVAAENLADPDVGAVTGRNVEVLGGSEVEAGYRNVQARVQTLESHLDSTLIFHGPFSAFKKADIVTIDPDSLADDTELAMKIRRNGKRVLYDPAIRYKEAAHSSFGKRRKQKDRRAMGLLRLLWRNRDALGRYGYYGFVVLPFNWWFMFVSPWLVMTTFAVASVGALLVAGPVGLAVPVAGVGFVALGSRDSLGPLQTAYSLVDTQVSLFRASLAILRGAGDGTWDVDPELREVYE